MMTPSHSLSSVINIFIVPDAPKRFQSPGVKNHSKIIHGRVYHVVSCKAKEGIRTENSQENSQANQFQTKEYIEVEKQEIDSHKTICACIPWGVSDSQR